MMCKKRGFILVVLALFLVVLSSFVFAESSGCYVYASGSSDLYCVENVLESAATADCNLFGDCDINEAFLENTACSSVAACEVVTCNVDCQDRTLGKCQELGEELYGVPGEAVPFEEYDAICSPGCCVLTSPGGDQTCQPNLPLQCDDLATKKGFDMSFLPGVVGASCINSCGADVEKGNLVVTVVNDEGDGVVASVSLVGFTEIAESKGNGVYEFSELTPSTYVVKVSAAGFGSESVSVIVEGEVTEVSVVLSPVEGVGSISGVVNGEGEPLSGATVFVQGGGIEEIATTLGNGAFSFDNLEAGSYVVTASKVGYKSLSQPVLLQEGAEKVLTFDLEETSLEGVTVTAFVEGNAQPGVSVFVDGKFKGKTKFQTDGSLFIPFLEEGEHTFFATFQGVYESGEEVFEVEGGEEQEFELFLKKTFGECSFGQPNDHKNVEVFALEHVLGKEQVGLVWETPCPEVVSYLVEKQEVGSEAVEQMSFSIGQTEYIDADVEWGTSYVYRIKAYYVDGSSPRYSEQWNEQTIVMGSAECENGFFETGAGHSFCQAGSENKKTVFTCSAENQVIPQQQCADAPGELFYCSPIIEFTAGCKSDSACSLAGTPFGLFSTEESCYGVEASAAVSGGAANYCYYDAAAVEVSTVVNQCVSCANVESCFDYQSEDACGVNSCLSEVCKWVEGASSPELVDYSLFYSSYNEESLFVGEETGAGYCVPEEKYEETDACGLCSAGSTLFENYYCTADVCSNLGACYSENSLSECNECQEVPTGSVSCETYVTEQECNGVGGSSKDAYERITRSADSCSWGACVWEGLENGAGQCVKDGDADGANDCLTIPQGGNAAACRADVTPPSTSLSAAETAIVSIGKPELTFVGDDSSEKLLQQNQLGELWYCVTPLGVDTCTSEHFEVVPYSGNLITEELVIDVTDSDFFADGVAGETYLLKFFSKDIYSNQEDVQEVYIYADLVLPSFTIGDEITINGDVADLTVFLEDLNEPVSCTFTLEPIIGFESVKTVTVPRDAQVKSATFTGLQGVSYDLSVECEDDFANVHSESKKYVFNYDQSISLINPPFLGAIAQNAVQFEVSTVVASQCELYETATNTLLGVFATNEEGKSHLTEPVGGLFEGEYAAEHKVRCVEDLSGKEAEAYFHFFVDFTPPQTLITLQEGSHVASPTEYGWEVSFIDSADVSFVCDAGNGGFACDETLYCLGEGCELASSPGYVTYEAPFTVTETTEICYYSTDIGNTPFPFVTCGDILVEGAGVTLEKPTPYMFVGEVWGVSNEPVFEWQFFTKVPTQECAFDFTENIDVETIEPFKKLQNVGGKYLFEGFPGEVISAYGSAGGVKTLYVQCANAFELVGSPQKMHLEYDPTAPSILSVGAEPNPVLEGITVLLSVETDDKSVCKYSDVSNGGGSKEYQTMEFSFPGEEEGVMYIGHEDIFWLSVTQPQQEFTIAVQCMNGAGDLSEVEEIGFFVDYTALGSILSLLPDGYTAATNVTLQAETSKTGWCEYKVDEEYIVFAETTGKTHSQPIGAADEGEYIFPVQCTMGDHTVPGVIDFVVDRTAPVISEVEDYTYSCGADELSVMVYSDEENISQYFYDVFEKGSKFVGTNGSSVASGSLLSDTVSGELPLKIPTDDLEENKSYFVKVGAIDAAGNLGKVVQSDGVTITDADHAGCEEDGGLGVTFESLTNASCTSQSIALKCSDSAGCGVIEYGTSGDSASCVAEKAYTGQNIQFEEAGWLCYYVESYSGENASGSTLVQFDDEDGDGIHDSCDLCENTDSGKVVGSNGCADGQLPPDKQKEDKDKDGLPDAWEKLYDANGCELSLLSADSDDDGISDADEDYDQDGYSNFQEYQVGSDPCNDDSYDLSDSQFPSGDSGTGGVGKSGGADVVAWVFLIVGLLLVLGGVGYLVYYYKYAPSRGKRGVPVRPRVGVARPVVMQKKKSVFDTLFSGLQRKKRDVTKDRSRRSVFSEFSSDSARIPHVDAALRGERSHERLHSLAKKYVKHKEDIKPGLRAGEKSVFARLDSIAKQSSPKDVKKVVSKKEANDIFSKLEKISRKRKKK